MAFMDRAQLGVKDGATWGTAVTVDRFYEYVPPDTISPVVETYYREGMRAGARAPLNTVARVVKRHEGTLSMQWLSKGMGWWLKHMLGTTSTGSVSDSKYTHTGTVGSLAGDFFTLQVNRPFVASDTDQAFTYDSCKISKWSLGMTRSSTLMFSPTIVAKGVATATSLASASYPSGTVEPYAPGSAAITVAGSSFCPEDWTLEVDNNLKLDTDKLCSGGAASQFYEVGHRSFSLTVNGADFDDLATGWTRYIASAPTTVSVVSTFTANTLIGTSSYPTTVVTLDEGILDPHTIQAGPERTAQGLVFKGLFDGSTSPLTIAYGSADATA